MTRVLEAALAEVAKLPPEEQDVLATILLDEIKSEQRWSESFGRSKDVLKALADEALAEFRQARPSLSTSRFEVGHDRAISTPVGRGR